MNKPAPDQQTAAIEARLFKDTRAYQDIMDLPRPVSKHHWRPTTLVSSLPLRP